jgi:Fe-S-cluster containining protein
MGPARFVLLPRTRSDPGFVARSFAIVVTESKPVPAYCLSIHARYRCADSGACCTAGWPIPADPPLTAAVARGGLGRDWTPERAFERHQGIAGPIDLLRTEDGHRCVFYEPGRRQCAVHRQGGVELLPTACRNFPRVTLRDPRGIFITLSHFCPTAAGLLLEASEIALVDAPPSLSLNGAVEGLDATGVLPPLLRPGMLTDADGYAAWETAAVAIFNDRRYAPREALAIIAAATSDTCRWQPGRDTLAARVHDAFDRARIRADCSNTPPAPGDHAVKAFLAAHLFASWCAYQDGGLAGVVRAVGYAHATLMRELLGRRSLGGGGSRASFIPAVRAADFRLRHSRSDVRPRSLSQIRRY